MYYNKILNYFDRLIGSWGFPQCNPKG